MDWSNFELLHSIFFPTSQMDKYSGYCIVSYNLDNTPIDDIGQTASVESTSTSSALPNPENTIELKYDITPDNTIQLSKSQYNPVPNHISRIVELQNKRNIQNTEHSIGDYLMYLNELFTNDNYYNYCTSCAQPLEIKGLKLITHCSNPQQTCNQTQTCTQTRAQSRTQLRTQTHTQLRAQTQTHTQCKKKYYTMVTDNRVSKMMHEEPDVFKFLLTTFSHGLTHPRAFHAFNPLPWITHENLLPTYDFNNFKAIVPTQFDPYKCINEIYARISSCSNDTEIMEIVSQTTYCLLKNIVSENYFSMSSKVLDDSGNKCIYVNYTADVESKFSTGNFLFHGSASHSWYPIIKNGLKVMSGTVLQACGAAHGNGIYLSDSFDFSLGYSNMGGVVGIFELSEDPSKYKKTTNIYVVPDDQCVLLRAIYVCDHDRRGKSHKNITEYFTKELHVQKQISKKCTIKLQNKRLNTELGRLNNLDCVRDVNVESDNLWTVVLGLVGGLEINIQIMFVNYPITPPVMRIMNSASVNVGNIRSIVKPNSVSNELVIDIPMLRPDEWKMTDTLDKIIQMLYGCLEESLGDGAKKVSNV